MAMECPTHNKELKKFEGISKTTGKPYVRFKCTAKDGEKWCEYGIWGQAFEKKAVSQAPDFNDAVAKSLNQIHEKLDHILEDLRNRP